MRRAWNKRATDLPAMAARTQTAWSSGSEWVAAQALMATSSPSLMRVKARLPASVKTCLRHLRLA